jgi:hypothetical protein
VPIVHLSKKPKKNVGANWLARRGNAMSPSSDKTMKADNVL